MFNDCQEITICISNINKQRFLFTAVNCCGIKQETDTAAITQDKY